MSRVPRSTGVCLRAGCDVCELTEVHGRVHDSHVAKDDLESAGENESSILTEPVDPAASARIGAPQQLGRFKVGRRIGAGGMGVVYGGHDPELARPVAIKLLHERSQDRLRREAQALARLDHPNVVQVYEVGSSDHGVYVAMQLVRGGSLGAWLSECRRDWRTIVEMYVAAGRGLAAAHASGIVHGDFKPENVLVGDDDSPRVVDFGLARSHVAEVPVAPRPPSSRQIEGDILSSPLSETEASMGTPAYMAPEQHRGEPATVASDQFSFCVALYEALYGRRPYPGTTPAAIAYAIEEGEIEPRPTDRPAPQWLYEALRRGLANDPKDRFASMDALLAELTSYRDTTLQVGRRARVAFVVAAMTVAALVFGVASAAVRLYGIELSFRLAMIISAITVVGVGAPLLALRRELTRSGMSEQLYLAFIAYLLFGPAMRLTGGLLDVPISRVLVFEAIGLGLFATLVALGFDRRLLRLLGPYSAWVVLMVAFPEWALEMHALGHVGLFGGGCYIWMREGLGPLGTEDRA